MVESGFLNFVSQSMAIDECLAVMRMMIATKNVADPAMRKLESGDNLAKLEQEAHSLMAVIALGIVCILDERR